MNASAPFFVIAHDPSTVVMVLVVAMLLAGAIAFALTGAIMFACVTVGCCRYRCCPRILRCICWCHNPCNGDGNCYDGIDDSDDSDDSDDDSSSISMLSLGSGPSSTSSSSSSGERVGGV